MSVKLIIKNANFKKFQLFSAHALSLLKTYVMSVIENKKYTFVIVDSDDMILYSKDKNNIEYRAEIDNTDITAVVDYLIDNPPTTT